MSQLFATRQVLPGKRGLHRALQALRRYDWAHAYDPLFHPVLLPLRRHRHRPWVRRLPNALTYARLLALVLGPLTAILIWNGHTAPAIAVFSFTAVLVFATDVLDGSASRLVGVTSQKGAVLDPLVDKLATLAFLVPWLVLVHRFYPDPFPLLLTVALLRVITDLALALVAREEQHRGRAPKAEIWGKLKFHFDGLALLAGYLALLGSRSELLTRLAIALLGTACILALLSLRGHLSNLRGS